MGTEQISGKTTSSASPAPAVTHRRYTLLKLPPSLLSSLSQVLSSPSSLSLFVFFFKEEERTVKEKGGRKNRE
jgi:hypothetical protein